MNYCICFKPIVAFDAVTLILGSMPGIRSLTLAQYYAHPQNRFWPLLTCLLNYAEVPKTYPEKLQMLQGGRLALWDVLAVCNRTGSLDSAITAEEVNDFTTFFKQYPQINKICFNGNKAYQIYKKYNKSLLADPTKQYIALPSTSPANAQWKFPMLKQAWSICCQNPI